MIKYSYKVGVYVSSYDLAKATGKKHQNLMTSVHRKYKYYIHYEHQDNRYYKNQKIYLLTPGVIRKINKNGVYDELLEKMEKVQKEKYKKIFEEVENFFKRFEWKGGILWHIANF